MQNLHRRLDRYYIEQIYRGDFAKICGLLKIYEVQFDASWQKLGPILENKQSLKKSSKKKVAIIVYYYSFKSKLYFWPI